MTVKETNLQRAFLDVIEDLAANDELARAIPDEILPLADQVANWREWVQYAEEYRLAFDSIAGLLLAHPTKVSSTVAINLLRIDRLLGHPDIDLV